MPQPWKESSCFRTLLEPELETLPHFSLHDFQGPSRGRLLGFLLVTAAGATEELAANADLHLEGLRMVGTFLCDHAIPWCRPTLALHHLLKSCLVVIPAAPFCDAIERFGEVEIDDRHGAGYPFRQVNGSDDGLERIGQDRALVAAPGQLFASPHPQELSDLQLTRDTCQSVLVYDEGPKLRKLTLVCTREPFHEPVADEQVDDGVSEKLQPLIVDDRIVSMLVAVALVGQGGEPKVRIQPFDPQALLEDNDAVADRSFHDQSPIRELLRKRFGQRVGVRTVRDDGVCHLFESAPFPLQAAQTLPKESLA